MDLTTGMCCMYRMGVYVLICRLNLNVQLIHPGWRYHLQRPISSIDEPLYNLYWRNMDALLDMAEEHVAFAKKIFGEQVFTEDEGLADRYFRIGRIQVR